MPVNSAANQATLVQQLMANGAAQGKALGLTIGVAPTAAQLASLSTNMVWMVDTVVQGQHVLAPVVYLSAATKSQLSSGAVIQATNADMQLTSLTNSGGTISGSNHLNVTTTGSDNGITLDDTNDSFNTLSVSSGAGATITDSSGNIVRLR